MYTKEHVRIAIEAALAASKVLMDFYENEFNSELKSDGSPVTDADVASSKLIKEFLSKTDFPVIDEETEQLPFEIRKTWEYCWCVDPLDGTKEFISKNGEFAINIALIHQQKAVFGLIASPVNEEILIGGILTEPTLLSFQDALDEPSWKKIDSQINDTLHLIVSRSHHSGTTLEFLKQLEEKNDSFHTIKKGSSLKFFNLVLASKMIYPRFAPTMEWDIAAGQAILEAAGGKVLHATKRVPLYYNKENLKNPYFIAYKGNVLF